MQEALEVINQLNAIAETAQTTSNRPDETEDLARAMVKALMPYYKIERPNDATKERVNKLLEDILSARPDVSDFLEDDAVRNRLVASLPDA